jgi:hypothetical protein
MKNNIVIFEDKNGKVELRADIEKDTIWATQDQIAVVFESSKQNIGQHLKNIFLSHELKQNSVVKNFFTTGQDGKRYSAKFYNLDAIIAVGYRVNSKKATQFRIWATRILHEYLVDGYVVNKRRLEESPESLVGLYKSIALLESMSHQGKLKGKLTLKLTEDLIPSEK